MRPLTLLVLGALASTVACGVPEVELPASTTPLTSDKSEEESKLAAITIDPETPEEYPYARFALRGTAINAARVVVAGAGNPVVGTVNPVQQTFCVMVDLASSPAQYSLRIQSQGSDGQTSEMKEVVVVRNPNAPTPKDAKDCDGNPIGS